ncbi:MAG: DNA polymerase III subunit gamma/tau [Planctomycetales bacterium]|nr:DNA polymerase III subunit gamma/tau [Planctomycetales bacterium]
MDQQSTHYTVLARRFRPQTFEEVIGQEHVAGGLRNAIDTGRVAHAYLFTGARGVGKTSMARILAKTLNCPSSDVGQPCHQCEVCTSIAAGQDVDVLEIDGASNRRIDDIRDLRRNVGIKSMRSQYKIYIIDEVHQLTSEAFNALLKTLEEPPENVKFIFCTTEPTALPDTIVSRCQRFDFGLIGNDQIAARLSSIAVTEGVEVSDQAVELVARRAGGSMRDSQSLFDQLLAFGKERIDVEDVHRLLGTAPDELLLAIIEPLVGGQPDRAIGAFETALATGAQQEELLGQLIECCRDLMVQAAGAEDVTVRSVGLAAAKRLSELAGDWGVETAIAAMQVLAETVSRTRWTRQSRALADLALVRIATLEQLDGVVGLLQQLADGTVAAPVADPKPAAQKKRADEPTAAVTSPPADVDGRDSGQGTDVGQSVEEPVSTSTTELETGGEEAIEPAVAEDVSVPTTPLETGREERIWGEVTGQISDLLREHVERVDRVAISGPNRLDLVFPAEYHFHKTFCERPEVMQRLEQLLRDVTGGVVQVRLILEETETAEATTEAPATEESTVEADPMVEEAQNVFGATVERVVPVNRPASKS